MAENPSIEQQFIGTIGNQIFNLATTSSGSTPTEGNNSEGLGSAGFGRAKELFFSWKTERGKNLRKWGSFMDRSKFSLPKPTHIPYRIKTNLSFFQTNYVIVFLILTLYCIITNPLFLLAILFCLGLYIYLFYWRSQPLKMGTHIVTDKEKTIFISLITLVLFYWASVGSTIFWLLGASLTIILLHALFFNPAEEASEDFIDFNSSFADNSSV